MSALASSNPIRLYSAETCPFAQRTRLVLDAKQLAYDHIEIDLDHPPDEFLAKSPYGKVPLLECGDDRIWESAVINEYLEERFPNPRLMPRDPGARALARIWIEYANNSFVPLFYKLLLLQARDEQREIAERLSAALLFLDERALAGADPYWLGETVSLVDFSFYPFFERFPVLERYRGFTLPEEAGQLQRWLSAMQAHPSVQACAGPVELYLERYARYADGSVESDTALEMLEK
ncbi:MAG: glutathione S-transferase N-terminal domain-containing protein [Gammaproteobacteria bacterium]